MSAPNIVVIDYGMGNIRSVQNALIRCGAHVSVTQSGDDFAGADALVLPGVGAFGEAMNNLKKLNLVAPIQDTVSSGTPFLGICLGMQLLADSSVERGEHEGLGLIPGHIAKIDVPKGLRLPHVGWNMTTVKQEQPLFAQARDGESYYFVHSYHYQCDEKYVAATTDYGKDVIAAVQREHIMGVQFHPERSQASGLRLLTNFIGYVADCAHKKEAVAC